MSSPNLPNLGSLSAKIAAANLRVDRVIDSLPGMMDHIIQAADRKEWREVSRLSSALAAAPDLEGGAIQGAAEDLATDARENSELQIKRSLLRLIGASGRQRRQGNPSAERLKPAE